MTDQTDSTDSRTDQAAPGSMGSGLPSHPRLRPLEAAPVPGSDGAIALHDPSRLSNAVLTLREAGLFTVSLLDGTNDFNSANLAFIERYGQPLPREAFDDVVRHLDEGYFLKNGRFDAYYQTLVEEYRDAPDRPMESAAAMGIDADSHGLFDDMLSERDASAVRSGRVVGIVAPHLDYARGRPCYADAYGMLVQQDDPPDRVVILGTNHFGLGTGVVGTGKDFTTPFGRTVNDVAFLERLEERVGSMRACELDHRCEHSIELQVLWLQHLFGHDRFRIVPFLCHDPCGPNGTASYDGHGVDLHAFALALRDAIGEDDRRTLLVAGADLSHVGGHFGDDSPLDAGFLRDVATRDRRAVGCLTNEGAEAFRDCVAEHGNPTRVCSVGCLYALATALPNASPTLLRYDQAVDQATQTCVTSAAIVFHDVP